MATDFYATYSRSFETKDEGKAPQPQSKQRGRGRGGKVKGSHRQPNDSPQQPLTGLTIGGTEGQIEQVHQNFQQPPYSHHSLPGLTIGQAHSLPQQQGTQLQTLGGLTIGGPPPPAQRQEQLSVGMAPTEGVNILHTINSGLAGNNPQQEHRHSGSQLSPPPPPLHQPINISPPPGSVGSSPPPALFDDGSKAARTLISTLSNVKRTKDGKYAVGQFVHVPVTRDGKKEIATITDINSEEGTVVIESERSGFALTVKEAQLNRAFLVILDLNGVLIHRKKSKSKGLKRPHVDEFLDFLLKHFVVGVWSSCIASNGQKIVDSLLGTEQRKLKFQMYRDDCTPNPTPEAPYGTRKDLLKVWARYPSSFNETNTVIIDDSADKCSHPRNAFVPSTFDGDTDAIEKDAELLRVMEVLQRVIDSDSLNPFREPAPTVAIAALEAPHADAKRPPGPPVAGGMTPVVEEDEEEECVVYAPQGL